jgi:hypothetical protein
VYTFICLTLLETYLTGTVLTQRAGNNNSHHTEYSTRECHPRSFQQVGNVAQRVLYSDFKLILEKKTAVAFLCQP